MIMEMGTGKVWVDIGMNGGRFSIRARRYHVRIAELCDSMDETDGKGKLEYTLSSLILIP